MDSSTFEVLTVTLNPAIDRTVTVDNFTAGQVNRASQVRSNPGGKGVNVAAALADYGHRVAATGFLGRDNSASFEALFAKKEIADHFVRIAGQTRVGIKITDPIQHQTTDINFPGPAPATADVETLRAQLAAVTGGWVVLGGSIPPGLDPSIYRDFVATLKAQGCQVLLDTSGAPLQQALEAAPHIIKPNIHELEALLGESLTNEEAVIAAARALIARGLEMVVVSMGQDGACFVTAEEVVLARPPSVEVKSTVGAGDAMVAGIVSAQLRGLGLADCARRATAFSLDALTRIESGLTSHVAVEAAARQVRITNHRSVIASH